MSNDSAHSSTFSFETTNQLSTVNIRPEKISKIVQTLDQNKAYRYDDISIKMIKICGMSICKPIQLLFNNCVMQGFFPNI